MTDRLHTLREKFDKWLASNPSEHNMFGAFMAGVRASREPAPELDPEVLKDYQAWCKGIENKRLDKGLGLCYTKGIIE